MKNLFQSINLKIYIAVFAYGKNLNFWDSLSSVVLRYLITFSSL